MNKSLSKCWSDKQDYFLLKNIPVWEVGWEKAALWQGMVKANILRFSREESCFLVVFGLCFKTL